MFAAEIRKRRVERMHQHTDWRWRLDEVYVKISGEMEAPKFWSLEFTQLPFLAQGRPKLCVFSG